MSCSCFSRACVRARHLCREHARRRSQHLPLACLQARPNALADPAPFSGRCSVLERQRVERRRQAHTHLLKGCELASLRLRDFFNLLDPRLVDARLRLHHLLLCDLVLLGLDAVHRLLGLLPEALGARASGVGRGAGRARGAPGSARGGRARCACRERGAGARTWQRMCTRDRMRCPLWKSSERCFTAVSSTSPSSAAAAAAAPFLSLSLKLVPRSVPPLSAMLAVRFHPPLSPPLPGPNSCKVGPGLFFLLQKRSIPLT